MVYKGEIIFVRLILPAILGIVLAIGFESNHQLQNAAFGFSLLLLLLAGVLWYKYQYFKVYFFKWLPGICVQLILCSLFYAVAVSKNETLSASHFSNQQREALVVTISSEPKQSGNILRFETIVNQALNKKAFYAQKGNLLVVLQVDSNASSFKYGDKLLIPYQFAEIDPPYNPGEFNYKQYLAYHGIYHQTFIKANQIKLLQTNQGNPIVAYAQSLRRKMVDGFEKYIPGKDAAALASTLILGYRADLSAEIISAYSKTGTMHVLSVSGMHVALVLAILAKMLGFRRNSKAKVEKAVVIISLIWFYSLVTGFSPSVIRAALMISLLILAKTINRKTNPYNVIAASALFLLFYNPYFLVDAGFQLSYLAVLGLIYLYPQIYHWFYLKNWLLDQTWSYTALSISAQLATAPLSIYYFHQFPVYFLVSNLLIVLPISVIMYAGLSFLLVYSLSGFLPWLQIVLKYTGIALGFCIEWVDKCLIYLEHLPLASISFFHHPFVYYLILFLCVLLLIIALQYQDKRAVFISLSLTVLLVVYSSFLSISNRNDVEIIFYSLRKNRAVCFFDGNTNYVFTDMERKDKNFTFSVKPSLDARDGDTRLFNGIKNINENVSYKNKCLQFSKWKILIWDTSFNKLNFGKHIAVNAVLLSGNPKVKLSRLSQYVHSSLILIDGTNKDYKIQNWVEEAKKLKLTCYVLKRHPAYRIKLKS